MNLNKSFSVFPHSICKSCIMLSFVIVYLASLFKLRDVSVSVGLFLLCISARLGSLDCLELLK